MPARANSKIRTNENVIPFATSLNLTYGPLERLGRLFLLAEQKLSSLGVSLSFGSFQDLAAANRANSETWRPLLPSFDPDLSDLGPENAFCLFGRNAAGELIATQAVRLFAWTETNFFEEAISLKLFYTDPKKSRASNEACRVTAQSMRNIDGRVLFSGAGWYHPEFRGQGLGELMPRLARYYAFSRWFTDYTICVMAEGVVKGRFPERAGYPHTDWELWMENMPMLRDGIIRAAAVWTNTEEMLEDLDVVLARLEGAQVDRSIEQIDRQHIDPIRPARGNR